MKYESNINEIQALIIRQLFARGVLRFSEINIENLPSDQFSYHLRQLTKNGMIEKLEGNHYQLSVMGRSRAILLDTKSSHFIQQGFIACRVVLSREVDGVVSYLFQRRTRVPYKDYLGEPGGKVLFGEDVAKAAQRNMKAETGLDCTVQLKGLVHFKDRYQNEIVQDKFFFVVAATNPVGELLDAGPTGINTWMTLEEIAAYPKVHQGSVELISMIEEEAFTFREATHIVTEY